MEGELDTADLLGRTNDLLHKVGINALPIPSLVELQQSASSMFVAVFEAIIQARLREVVRVPSRSEDWINNAQVVIAKLQLLPMAKNMLTPEVTGEAVVTGNPRVISQLVDIFHRISEVYTADFGVSHATESSAHDTDAHNRTQSSNLRTRLDATADSGDTVPQPEASRGSSSGEASEDDRVRLNKSRSSRCRGGAVGTSNHPNQPKGKVARTSRSAPPAVESGKHGLAQEERGRPSGGGDKAGVQERRRAVKRQKQSVSSPGAAGSGGRGAKASKAPPTIARVSEPAASDRSVPTSSSAPSGRKAQRPSTSHTSRPSAKATATSAVPKKQPRPHSAPSGAGSNKPRNRPKPTEMRQPQLSEPHTHAALSEGRGLEVEAFGRGYPSIWQSFLDQYLRSKTADLHGGNGVEQRNQRNAEVRNELYMRQYEDVVKDHERSKRLRHMAEARQAELQAKSLAHRERVERIKAARLAENIKAQRISDRLQKETLSENRMRFILKQILKRIHEWKRDEDKEELDRVKELHRFGLMKADVIESMYGERLTMVKEAMRSRHDENKTVYRSQEVLLASILRELVGLRDDRVRAVMERDQHRQTAALRKSDELFHTLCDMMQIEDWEGMRRDRFSTRHGSGLDKFLLQTQRGLDKQRAQHSQVLKDRRFKQAYNN